MIVACTYVMMPLAAILLLTLKLRSVDLDEAAQTATAGLVTLIPEGLVLLMSVTFAVAAVRLARRDTLVQQMSATESLAAVDTICVDKTGTLTDGELRLLGVEIAEAVDPDGGERGAGALRRERRRAQPNPGDDRRPLPGPGRRGSAARSRSPRSGSGAGCALRRRTRATCWARPTSSPQAGALTLTPGLARKLEEETAAGRRVVAFGESAEALPDDPAGHPPPTLTPLALVVLEETLRPDAAETIAFMREEDVDLKLISGDAAGDRDRGRLRGRRAARRRGGRGPRPARGPGGAGRGRR